jgi:hypothetical protein
MLTLIFKIKVSTPFECKYKIISVNPSIFVDAGEDSVTADDVVVPSNPLVVLVEEEELEEAPLVVNVFQ